MNGLKPIPIHLNILKNPRKIQKIIQKPETIGSDESLSILTGFKNLLGKIRENLRHPRYLRSLTF